MAPWPAITEHELLERLAADSGGFHALFGTVVTQIGQRRFTPKALAHALGYPWSRPTRSYVLDGDLVSALHDLGAPRRAEVLERYTAPSGERQRTPMLAIGSNAAPDVLRRKFAHFDAREDRDVLVLAGDLRDFDVGFSAQPTLYGSMPATLFPSPGTAVRTAVLWVTPRQFTQLVWSELSYSLGQLATPFVADEPEYHVDEVICFVSRFGAFAPRGAPVALGALPASGRRGDPFTQAQALDAAAGLALGPPADHAVLVREVFENFPTLLVRLRETVHRHAEPFASERWTPFPAAGNGGDAR
jgi:hypothetical protein